MLEDAKRFAKTNNLRVVEISNYIENKISHRTITDAGVEEFLGLFAHSKAVFTNAFHGTCFALTFEKPFLTYARGTKDSRVTSLLSELGLMTAFVGWETRDAAPSEIDFETIRVRLETLRNESETFLLDALSGLLNPETPGGNA